MKKKIVTILGLSLIATTIACNTADKEEQSFVGCWKYDGFEYYIILEEDMTWKMIYENGDIDAIGEFALEEDGAYLYEDNEEFLQLSFVDDGKISASNGFHLYATEEPDWGFKYTEKDFIGCWQYDGFDLFLFLNEDKTWTIQMEDGTVKETGTFMFEDDYVQLYKSEEVFLKIYLKEDMMYDSGSRVLVKVEE